MFIRVNTTPNSPRKSVQIVESFREGKKVKKRILRHVGIATNDREEAMLRRLAEQAKAEMLHKRQPGLFTPEQLADIAIDAARRKSDKPLPIADLRDLREEQRIIVGIPEVYGRIYRSLRLDTVLPAGRQRMSNRVLFHMVMARIANPDSKRASVRRLERDFGIQISLEKVYRMMDRLTDEAIDEMRRTVEAGTRSLFPEPVDLVLYDCTTLHFESSCADTLRNFGYSKDGKHGEVQVVLALAVTHGGLPLTYEAFPGNTWEGDSFLPTLRKMHPQASDAAIIADAGMFSADNLDSLAAKGCRFVVGVRLRNLPKALTARVLDTARYRSVPDSDLKVGVFRHKGRRLVVSWSAKRARKDARDRQREISKLVDRLRRSRTPKQLLGKSGYHRYVRVVGEAAIEIDEEKILAAERWDGLLGVVTNIKGIGVRELFDRYRELWQVEESFRVSKHDLRVRPVFHWTEKRIRAHLAISYMAYACVRHLAWRVRLQKGPMSPKVIREALIDRQLSILEDPTTQKRYGIPSRPSAEAKAIYATLGLKLSAQPYELPARKTETKSA